MSLLCVFITSAGILDFSVDNNQLGFVTWELRAIPLVQAISSMCLERNRPQAKSCLRLTQFSYPKNGILIPSSYRLNEFMYAKELACYLVHSMCFRMLAILNTSITTTVTFGALDCSLWSFQRLPPSVFAYNGPPPAPHFCTDTLSIRNLYICFRSCWKFLGREPSNSVYSHLIY